MTPEQRDQLNKRRRERYASDIEYRKKKKLAQEKWYAKKCASDPEYREKHLAYMREYSRNYSKKQTLFKRITQSEEALADTYMFNHDGKVFKSLLLPNMVFSSREEAHAATVAKLQEVTE